MGLGHPHADVQRAAVKALARLGREDLAHQQRDALAPAVAAMLSDAGAGSAQGRAGGGRPSPSSDALPGLPPPAPLRPWTDEGAQERYAALLEAPADALEFELALAWLATSGQVAATIAPLAKRARYLAERDEQHYAAALLAAHDPERVPAAKVLAKHQEPAGRWRVGAENVGEPKALPSAEKPPLPSFVTRLREVAGIVRAGRRAVRCWPRTDAGLGRCRCSAGPLRGGQESGAPFPVDLTQALLRVPPEQRARVVEPPAARGRGSPTFADRVAQPWVGNLEGRWLSAMGVWHPEIKRSHGSAFGHAPAG